MKKTKLEMTEREAFKKGKTALDETLIDQWIAEHYEEPEDILGQEGLLARLTKAAVERALSAELTHHLGYARAERRPWRGQLPQWFERQDAAWRRWHGGDRRAARPPQHVRAASDRQGAKTL